MLVAIGLALEAAFWLYVTNRMHVIQSAEQAFFALFGGGALIGFGIGHLFRRGLLGLFLGIGAISLAGLVMPAIQ